MHYGLHRRQMPLLFARSFLTSHATETRTVQPATAFLRNPSTSLVPLDLYAPPPSAPNPTLMTMMASCTTYDTLVWMSSSSTLMQRSVAFSSATAQRPMARTDLRRVGGGTRGKEGRGVV